MGSLPNFISVQYVESGGACSDRRTSSVCLLLLLIYFIMDLLLDVILGSGVKLVV